MKSSGLQAVVHNVADSLGSGCSLLTGYYDLNLYKEAARTETGAVSIDFLAGAVIEGGPSDFLDGVAQRARDAMAELLAGAGSDLSQVTEASARFWSDAISSYFTTTVRRSGGRRRVTYYQGNPGRRMLQVDQLGRLRPKQSIKA